MLFHHYFLVTKKVIPTAWDFRIVQLSQVTKKSYRPAIYSRHDIRRLNFLNEPGRERLTQEIPGGSFVGQNC
jgi:hypothetical protein